MKFFEQNVFNVISEKLIINNGIDFFLKSEQLMDILNSKNSEIMF